MEWPPKTYVLEDVKPVKDMDIKLGEYYVSLKNNNVIDYKDVKDTEFSKMIKETANLPSLKIFLDSFNGKQITGEDYVKFRNKYWMGEDAKDVPNDVINAFSHNRLTRSSQLGNILEMSNDTLKVLFNIDQQQVDEWREKFKTIMSKSGEFYKETPLEEKEKIANELDVFLREIYEKYLGIKPDKELFKNKVN